MPPRVQPTYSDLMLFWPASCVAGHTPPLRGTIEAHTVEEGAVGVCAPRCVCFGCAQARGQLLGNLLRRSAEVNDAPVGVVVQVLEIAEPVEVVRAVFPGRRSVEARLRG